MTELAATAPPLNPAPVDAWQTRLAAARQQLVDVIPAGTRFLLVDEEQLRDRLPPEYLAIPFPEQDGQYWGPPAHDAAAIAELHRQRRAGARFIAFVWPAFWWLDHYARLASLVRSCFREVVRTEEIIVFDLGTSRGFATWKLRDTLSRASDLRWLRETGRTIAGGFSWWAGMAKLAWSRDARAERHLCALIAAGHASALPTIALSQVLERIRAADGANGSRAALAPATLHPLLRGGGSGAAAEMAAMAAIIRAKCPRRVLEFGTYDGCFAWHAWANSDETAQILTLDLPPNIKVQGSSDIGFQGVTSRPFLPHDPRVRLVEIDSREWRGDFGDVDLCFIDAGHTYGCVKSDTEKAMSLVRAGGVILWHDATWRGDGYGVNRFLLEKRREGLDVRRLVVSDFDLSTLAVLIR
jgi:predicted O-methyltransferase YrrM